MRKSSQRKSRYLLSFPGRLHPLGVAVEGGACKVGTLQNLDSQNPTLDIDFGSGRGVMRLHGTVVYPAASNFITLLPQKKNLLCDQVFQAVIVFGEARWLANPTENVAGDAKALPQLEAPPEGIKAAENTWFRAGGGVVPSGADAAADDGDGDDDDEPMDIASSPAAPASSPPAPSSQRSRRAAAAQPGTYAVDDEDDFAASASSDDYAPADAETSVRADASLQNAPRMGEIR